MSTFWRQIYSDIRSCQDFDSNIFGYLFGSIFRTQTDSEDVFVDFLCILYFAYGYFVDINDKKCYLDCKSTELVPVLTNIFEYSNIFDPNIYSNIRSYQNFNTNIFGYSFVSKMFIRIYSDIRSYHFLDTNIFGYSFVSKSIRMSHSGLRVVYF